MNEDFKRVMQQTAEMLLWQRDKQMDIATKKRFEDALASAKLKELAEQMTTEGLSQVAIYLSFDSFRNFLDEAHREADEEALCDCLASIIGACSLGRKWFDHFLTNEEIYEYWKTIA